MKLETATPEQGAELSTYFKKFPLHGPVDILIDRGRDFFATSKIQSDTQITYTLRDEDSSELLGLASFVITDTLLGGKPARIAFGRDLRISETRKAVIGWSQHFLPVMEEVRKVFGVEAFFSVLNTNDIKALNTFVRPRPGKRPLPRYFQHRRFNLVSLHGRMPWASKPLKSVRIRRGSPHLRDALMHYLILKARERDFAPFNSVESLENCVASWQGLKWDDFLVVMDMNDNIVGCCAPWNPGGIEDFIPLKYSLAGHNFRQFLKFGKTFGWTRPLTKPVHRLGMEASLNFRYLNFLCAENEDVFESLVWHAFEEASENEFLVYTQMRSDLHLRRPLSWISSRLPYAIYAMVPPDQEPPRILHPSEERAGWIEPFFC